MHSQEQEGDGPELDLTAYLERIGYAGELRPSLAVLQALHLAHATHIPFENLDILLGRPIRLDLASLQAKLVASRRGGYCFEQNLLFSAVLRQLGFSVTQLAARVRYRTASILPRTHMLLLLDLAGERWLADVGFGAEGLLLPVPMTSGQCFRQFAWTYRVVEEDGLWVLQSRRDDAWLDLYAFSLEPQQAIDYEIANHYVSTHPGSRFVQMLTVQQLSPEVRHILRNHELVEDHGDKQTVRTLADDDDLLNILDLLFGLQFSPGTRFRCQ
ncbi:MAG: arylamine N-acetyltransferase [Rhodocyclaceae bacterium]|nr:MAG: arylamine N-acetyltransferase [Rhodocyclaceae bacterium]